MNKILSTGCATLLLLTSQAFAHEDNNFSFNNDECSIDFNYGVVVEAQNIRFLNDDSTYVQINNNQQLFVKGKEVELTASQQSLLREYAQGITTEVPQIIDLALNAVELAFSAINQAVTGLGLEDDESGQRVNAIFVKIKDAVNQRFSKDNGHYYLAEQNFNEFDQYMEDELSAEIEAIISDSVGNILIAVGNAMNDEDGSFDEKMEAFGKRMETMGDNIEQAVEARAEELGVQAEQLCGNLKNLDMLEEELSDNVDELAQFNLIKVAS